MGSVKRRACKKLVAWSRWITSADGIGPGYCTACKASRGKKDACARCPEPKILPENWSAVRLYLSAQTQWRYASTGMGAVRVGLDYTGVDSVARTLGLDDNLDAFYGLQEIEHAMLKIDSEHAAKEKR